MNLVKKTPKAGKSSNFHKSADRKSVGKIRFVSNTKIIQIRFSKTKWNWLEQEGNKKENIFHQNIRMKTSKTEKHLTENAIEFFPPLIVFYHHSNFFLVRAALLRSNNITSAFLLVLSYRLSISFYPMRTSWLFT